MDNALNNIGIVTEQLYRNPSSFLYHLSCIGALDFTGGLRAQGKELTEIQI